MFIGTLSDLTKPVVKVSLHERWGNLGLSSAHRQFVVEYLEAAQQREAAVIEQFLSRSSV